MNLGSVVCALRTRSYEGSEMSNTDLSEKEICSDLGIAPVTRWRWNNDPRYADLAFPQPFRFGKRDLRWDRAEYDTWKATRRKASRREAA